MYCLHIYKQIICTDTSGLLYCFKKNYYQIAYHFQQNLAKRYNLAKWQGKTILNIYIIT